MDKVTGLLAGVGIAMLVGRFIFQLLVDRL